MFVYTPVYHAVCQPVNRVERPGNIPTVHRNTTCTFSLLKGQCHRIPHNSWTFSQSKEQCHCIPHNSWTFSQSKEQCHCIAKKNTTCTFPTVKRCHRIGNTSWSFATSSNTGEIYPHPYLKCPWGGGGRDANARLISYQTIGRNAEQKIR